MSTVRGSYWFELMGGGGTGLTDDRSIDRGHVAQRAKMYGHVTAEPLLLLPQPVEQVVRAWAAAGAGFGPLSE